MIMFWKTYELENLILLSTKEKFSWKQKQVNNYTIHEGSTNDAVATHVMI